MKTVIVNIPEKKEDFFLSLFKKNKLRSRVLTEEEREELAIAKWIDEGMETEDVSEEVVYSTLRKHGVKI